MSLSVLAFAALGATASADPSCDLTDGFAITPAAFEQEADACFEGLVGVSADTWIENQLLNKAAAVRDDANYDALTPMASLRLAARAHAYDMAVRGYVGHDDLEGRTHLDRVRMFDRTELIGAFGANIAILKAGATADEIQAALLADPANKANMERRDFDHIGVAAVEADGKLYVVQLFARVEGSLRSPLPATAQPNMNIAANLEDKGASLVGWSIVTASGETVAQGTGRKLPAVLPANANGFLQLDVEYGRDVYTLKGPAISAS